MSRYQTDNFSYSLTAHINDGYVSPIKLKVSSQMVQNSGCIAIEFKPRNISQQCLQINERINKNTNTNIHEKPSSIRLRITGSISCTLTMKRVKVSLENTIIVLIAEKFPKMGFCTVFQSKLHQIIHVHRNRHHQMLEFVSKIFHFLGNLQFRIERRCSINMGKCSKTNQNKIVDYVSFPFLFTLNLAFDDSYV